MPVTMELQVSSALKLQSMITNMHKHMQVPVSSRILLMCVLRKLFLANLLLKGLLIFVDAITLFASTWLLVSTYKFVKIIAILRLYLV